jgi:glycerol-3-phosphate dehydrogenase
MAFGHAALESPAVDVVVVGAGVNGAAVSLALTRAGYRVLLIDQADVAGGTSQASTMLIWGGLLYLRRFDLRAVFELSRDRDRLIAEWPAQVRPGSILYAPAGRLPSAVIRAALHAYWRMGDGRRRPEALSRYPEQALFRQPQRPVHTFEEGLLVESDARFVLALVQAATRMGARVRTYTRIDHLDHHRQGHWTLGVTDTLTGAQALVSARCVVNATGA